MKLLLASILLMLSFNICSAQSGYFDYEGKDLPRFLSWQIRAMPIILDNCLMPFTYVKFKVTKENTVDSLIVTNNSFPDVKTEIARVLALTNGHWNTDQAKDKWLIVPLIFYTDYKKNFRGKGCDFKKIVADQNKEMNYENKEPNAVYFSMVKVYSEWN